MSGNGTSWAICKSAPRSRQITTPAPHHSVFYRPDALAVAQLTASKHRRHKLVLLNKYKNICTRNTSKYKKHFHFSSKLGSTSFLSTTVWPLNVCEFLRYAGWAACTTSWIIAVRRPTCTSWPPVPVLSPTTSTGTLTSSHTAPSPRCTPSLPYLLSESLHG